jgi:hypothetical protein
MRIGGLKCPRANRLVKIWICVALLLILPGLVFGAIDVLNGPPSSRLPPNLASLTIDYRLGVPISQTMLWDQQAGLPAKVDRPWHRTVRDGPTLARLAGVINAMSPLAGHSNCSLDPHDTDLIFRTQEGRSLEFIFPGGCTGLYGPGGVILDDAKNTLWKAIDGLSFGPRY